MYVLGISAFYHDSSACLLKNGKIIAAVQEERFSRKKNDNKFPHFSIKYCLEEANIGSQQINYIVFYEKPFLKFERLLETYLAFAPKGFKSFIKAMPLWVKDKLFQKSILIKELKNTLGDQINWRDKLLFSEHHLSHAASAFFPSPFDSAAILTVDGVGEWTTTSLAIGKGKEITILKEIHFPHSLGLLYSAFTYYLGFKVNSGEYKIMGLAPYGKPQYKDLICEKLVRIASDGSFQLDMSYFDYATGLTMTNKKFDNLFGGPPRKPETKLTQREMDIAASIQKVIEEIIVKLGRAIFEETNQRNLCLAGGVALNCVANGILSRENIFDNIWVQPASGDAGGSLGAAFEIYHRMLKNDRIINKEDSMQGGFLGPKFETEQIEYELQTIGANFSKLKKDKLIDTVAKLIADGNSVGWMNGRMEFGPRSLGSRSILADPRSDEMQKKLNLQIKYRESFRPFAPSILFEDVTDWFDIQHESPYMQFVSEVKREKLIDLKSDQKRLTGLDQLSIKRSDIPAVTHVDNSARVHTVKKDINPVFYDLIAKFKSITGCPILINTSFNVRGEPIVCTAMDAYKCFMNTELDVLVIEDLILFKKNQNEMDTTNFESLVNLD